MGRHSENTEASRRWRRRVGIVGGIALAAGAVVGVAGATPTTSTTDVSITPLTVGHKVLSNATIAANKTSSPVVAGGSTTVPTNATTVRLTVTAKGTKAGVLNFYPAGNVGGGSGQFLAYPAGNVLASTVIQENVGQSNELTFANTGAGSVVVNATITGYSTQVTAGDIGSTGGTTGQVLTNNGAGGATWQTQGQAFGSQTCCNTVLPSSFTNQTVDTVTVPAGAYAVHAEVLASGTDNDFVCNIVSPTGNFSMFGFAAHDASTQYSQFGVQGLVQTTGGTITLQCLQYTTGGAIYDDSLIATQVNSVSGTFARTRSTTPVPPPVH